MADQVLNFNEPGEGNRGALLIRRISWAAIFSGVLVALAVEVLFVCFGLFIGFRMHPGMGARLWSVLWYFIGAFFSLMAGGWVAGYLGGNPRTGKAHGIVTWSLATVASFAVLSMFSWGLLTQGLGMVKTAAVVGAQAAQAAPMANREMTPGEAARAQAEASQAFSQTLNQAQQLGPSMAQAAGYNISTAALMLLIGLIIGACGALIGGARGAHGVISTRAV
jgi:hypothetical protein